MMSVFTESTVEEAVLEWTDELAYAVLHGPEIAPGEPAAERETFGDVLLMGRLRDAIERINPKVPDEARDEALRRVIRTETPNLARKQSAVSSDAGRWDRCRVSGRWPHRA